MIYLLMISISVHHPFGDPEVRIIVYVVTTKMRKNRSSQPSTKNGMNAQNPRQQEDHVAPVSYDDPFA